MEIPRADYNLKSENFSNLNASKLKEDLDSKFQVKADLFLICFNKDHKSFWRHGKPVNIKAGEVLISNSGLEVKERESASFDILKVSAKMLACYINERLALCLKAQLPQIIYEWPEILVKPCSPLANAIADIPLRSSFSSDFSGKQALLSKVLKGLFQSLDLNLFNVINRLKNLKSSSRQELLQKVAMVNEYMHRNLAEDLGLEMMSDLVGYSHFHFQRQFKLAMGISPTKKLSFLRLKKAKELIKNTDYRLKEIAFMVGYNDLPTFSKAYKRQFGESPNLAR